MRIRPVLAAALLFAGPASAKTPDGYTPSVEDLCDKYHGAAFGLCNAYCEAMDCDHDAVRAADDACTSVAEQFKDKTGRDLFCTEEVPCEIVAEDDIRTVNIGEMPQTISVLGNDYTKGGALTFKDYEIKDEYASTVTVLDASKGVFRAEFGTYFTYNACCSTEGDGICDSGIVSVTVLQDS